MTWKIPLFKTYWEDDDIEAVSRIIKRGTYWATGPEIEEFEKKIAEYVGTKYALVFNSGTSALHTLLLVHNVKGGEVIVPSFTFIATANAVLLAGGTPVFAESEAETYGLDSEDVRRRINKRTKAIIALHYGGFPSKEIKELRRIADENNILLIEDAAESLGASIGKKKVGTFGDSAIFSFCQNKVISTGEGGVIVTDSKEVYEKAKYLRSHGRVELSEDYFSSIKDNDYIQVGYNFRMPTISAALGLSQLKKVDKVIDLRQKTARYFSQGLKDIKGLETSKEIKGHKIVYQMYTIKLKDEKTRNDLQNHLAKKGIMSKVYFNPVHLKTIYVQDYDYKKGDLPVTENLSKRVLTLPLYPGMKKEDIDYIIKSIKEYMG